MQYKNVTYRHKKIYEQSNTTDIAQIAHPPDVKGTVHSSTLCTNSSNLCRCILKILYELIMISICLCFLQKKKKYCHMASEDLEFGYY